MPQDPIEPNIPGAGKLSAAELQAISQKSCSVRTRWDRRSSGCTVTSPTTRSCASTVPAVRNEDMIREHARKGGFPADKISEIKTTIDPTTAE